ncbi:MAG: SMC family ATPase, partial [Oscillospiraceae bacterium]|nr:SMC family ATPase [Oscillospiraceae bacterium]
MRPVTLTMRAFGSFAKETEVRFEDFRTGLYLVVGETGAGKTTIFDAIVFALFGSASGSNRKPEMMHSDYVDKSEDTEVRLVFDHCGKRYTVIRTIHFSKKRGAEGGYNEGKQDAVLQYPDGIPVSGSREVSRRCEELLGLNADQFRKIVMLAQGEFREFLSADSGKKSEILGKLFDNSEYVRYQNLLGSARATLEAKRRQYLDSVDAIMRTTFVIPEDAEEDNNALYDAKNHRLVDNLDRLIECETEKTAELAEKKAAAQRAVDEINTRKGAAESNNQKLDELLTAREHKEKLDEQRGEMERLSEECTQADKALHKVCPARDRLLAAKDVVQKTKAEIEALKEKTETLQKQFDKAKADADADVDAKLRMSELDVELHMINESLPRYDELMEKQTELNTKTNVVNELQGKLQAAETQRGNNKNKLAEAQDELLGLENADADAVLKKTEYETAQKNAKEIKSVNGIINGVDAVRREEKELAADVDRLSMLAAAASEAEAGHHRKYQAFVSGQAGLMAAELKQELAKNGRALCPVCHTEHTAGKAHEFAECIDDTPTQDEVKAAKEEYDRREKARSAQENMVERKKADLDSRRKSLVAQAQKLLPDCGDWQTLSAEEYLAAAAERFDKAENDAKLAYDDACRKQERKNELKASCDEHTKELEKLDREIDDCKEKKVETEKTAAALRGEVDSLKSDLPFETRGEAEERRDSLQKERNAIEGQINAHRSALDAAKEAIDKAHGELRGKENAEPEQEEAEKAVRRGYETALAENGFFGENALDAALAPIGDADGEEWLELRRKSINDYNNDCLNTDERIATLTEQTKDLRYIDLEELKKELGEAGELRDAADNAYSSQEKMLYNHKSVREKVSSALDELAKTNGAWSRLDKLAALALGTNADGGKLSFERYVMGTIFKEVLEMANRRLDVMSGGCYSLVHSLSAGRTNSLAGLEIEVLDVATGKQRAANSLSGGESFQVSLSLALGLSDVVQSHAGGIGLDTMFIDEGFGTLDGGALDNAITVLNQLTEGNRLVGIISHVDKLEESIPQKLRVKKTA